MSSRALCATKIPHSWFVMTLLWLTGISVSNAALLMPDLTVTDLAQKNGVISFTLKNIGTKATPTGHTTLLSVNDKQVDSLLVTVAIVPNGVYMGTFKKYVWKCTTSGKYTVLVTADGTRKIDEINEKNNTRQEVWTCDATAPAITVGPTAMYITETSAKISWTTNEDSDSVVRYGTKSGQYKSTKSTPAPTTDHKIFLDDLQPGTVYYYVVESTDAAGNTRRSPERTFQTKAVVVKRPDLQIDDVWETKGKVFFRIVNSGSASAPVGHVAAFYVDGQLKASLTAGSTLAAGAEAETSFPQYTWTCTKAQYTVRMTADSTGVIQEEDETNNSRTETWTCDVVPPKILSGPTVSAITQTTATVSWTTDEDSDSLTKYGTQSGMYTGQQASNTLTRTHQIRLQGLKPGTLYYFVVQSTDGKGNAVTSPERNFRTVAEQAKPPDLTVDDVWEQDHAIYARVKNVGEGAAAAGHKAGLYVADRLIDSETVALSLNPGQIAQVKFPKFYFECIDPTYTLRVAADIDDRIDEKNETNNAMDKTLTCDVAPPKIVAGPTVSAITAQSALISWDTDKPCDSSVLYDDHAGMFGKDQTGTGQVVQHRVSLKGLAPGVLYQFKVRSADTRDRTVSSKPGYFQTPPKADNQKPRITSLTFARQPTKYPCYKMMASATDNIGVEKVQFLFDGHLVYTDYSAPYEATIVPGMVGIASAEFYRPHAVEAWAFDGMMSSGSLSSLFEPVHDCNDINAEFEWPFPNEKVYIPGTRAPAGTEIPIQVYAVAWSMELVFSGGGVHTGPSEPDMIWDIVEQPVREVRFFMNGSPIGTVPSQPDNRYAITWDAENMPLGTHVIRADAVRDDDCIQTIAREFQIRQGAVELDVTRKVWREENAFRVQLTVRNEGTLPYQCDVIHDNVDGLQPVAETYSSYQVIPHSSFDGRQCEVDLDLFDGSSQTVEIRAGTSKSFTYYAVPIQFASPGPTHYAIGEDEVRITYLWGMHPWTFSRPCSRTESGMRLFHEIDAAIEGSDYQILTNPQNCAAEFGDANDLLGQIAKLAQYRKAILGYPYGPASDDPVWVSECVRTWGSDMKGSDGIDNHYLTNGYLLLVGETEILPAWTVDVPDVEWSNADPTTEAELTDLPYADVHGADHIPELITGRIIGDTTDALIQTMRASMESTFDRSYGVVTSGVESDWEDFVGTAYDISRTWVDQGTGGVIMTDDPKIHHWSAYVHKEQAVSGYDYPLSAGEGFLLARLDTGLHAIRIDPDTNRAYASSHGNLDLIESHVALDFACPFDPGDALAAGDLDADGQDEILVGSLAGDQLVVGYDPPYTDGARRWAFEMPLDPFDIIACGKVMGWAQEQIVVAKTTGGGSVRIYEYANRTEPLIGLNRTLTIPFTNYDGFVVADVNAANPGDEIVVGSDDNDRIYVYDKNGNTIAEIACDPYTAYDSLIAGDMDGDGADELAVLIDDEIDGKRRMKTFQNDCWYLDPNSVWKIKKNQSATVYSQFLPFGGARITGASTHHDGVACRDLDGDGREEIYVAHEGHDRLYVLDGYYSQGWKDRYLPTLQGMDDRIDVFALSGHGNSGACSPLGIADVNTLSLDAHPLVFAFSCLTGYYEGNDDNGFAERFLARGAAGYIGATEVSSTSCNADAGSAFFVQWDPAESAGKAFADYRRNRASTGDSVWELWAIEYNYYGDPKFGALPSATAALDSEASRARLAIAAAPGVPTAPEVLIPGYEVRTVNGKDRVTIPGGERLMEDGQPMVPYYIARWEVPAGTVVQNVQVLQRSELKTDIGLRLPIATLNSDADTSPALPVAPAPGWYPRRDLDWRIVPSAGGTSTLVVLLYPFFYNSQTTEVRFYQQYVLEIETTSSAVAVTALATDKPQYQPGEVVTASLDLSATGQGQDLIVEVVIRRYGTHETVAGLLLKRLFALSGAASYAPTWDTQGAAPGVYAVEARISNPAGQLLAQRACTFKIGTPQPGKTKSLPQ